MANYDVLFDATFTMEGKDRHGNYATLAGKATDVQLNFSPNYDRLISGYRMAIYPNETVLTANIVENSIRIGVEENPNANAEPVIRTARVYVESLTLENIQKAAGAAGIAPNVEFDVAVPESPNAEGLDIVFSWRA